MCTCMHMFCIDCNPCCTHEKYGKYKKHVLHKCALCMNKCMRCNCKSCLSFGCNCVYCKNARFNRKFNYNFNFIDKIRNIFDFIDRRHIDQYIDRFLSFNTTTLTPQQLKLYNKYFEKIKEIKQENIYLISSMNKCDDIIINKNINKN